MIYTHILTYLLGEDLHRFENPCGRKQSDQNLGYLIDRGLYFIHIYSLYIPGIFSRRKYFRVLFYKPTKCAVISVRNLTDIRFFFRASHLLKMVGFSKGKTTKKPFLIQQISDVAKQDSTDLWQFSNYGFKCDLLNMQ